MLKSYLTGKLFNEHSDDVHLKAALEWLARAQDVCGGDGVSSVFSLKMVGAWPIRKQVATLLPPILHMPIIAATKATSTRLYELATEKLQFKPPAAVSIRVPTFVKRESLIPVRLF